MELMLTFAEDTVGAQQFILSFAEDGNHAIMLKTPDLIVRPDQHRVGVECMRQLLTIATKTVLDSHIKSELLLGRRASGCRSLVGVGSAMDGVWFLLGLGSEGLVHVR